MNSIISDTPQQIRTGLNRKLFEEAAIIHLWHFNPEITSVPPFSTRHVEIPNLELLRSVRLGLSFWATPHLDFSR
jgi:hypothetical protein